MTDVGQSAEERLRDLGAVTDTALGRLDVEDLLVELLSRIRTILGADTAAVLLLDHASDQLVARAACGLEEEVRQGVQIPVGVGFAGTIAKFMRPVALDRVDSTTVANPILWEKGIQVMLGVPLLAADRLVGVLHIGRLDARPFDEQDTELLQIVAERVVGAIESRQFAVEQAAAALLERSLLPADLPSCPGLEFAVRYVTPDDRTVGGDWYDLFTVPSGDLWIVVGDVAGHGLDAAVVMGRIRSAMRSYALLGGPPEAVLELTDRKVEHFEIGAMATVICAVSSPPFQRFRIATAGHPAPVVATTDAPPSLLSLPIDPPLGASDDIVRSATDVVLPDGAVMVLYTDGLIERRGEPIDVGIEHLRRHVHVGSADLVCRDVLHDVIGSRSPSDDVAMVVVRRGASDAERAAPPNALS